MEDIVNNPARYLAELCILTSGCNSLEISEAKKIIDGIKTRLLAQVNDWSYPIKLLPENKLYILTGFKIYSYLTVDQKVRLELDIVFTTDSGKEFTYEYQTFRIGKKRTYPWPWFMTGCQTIQIMVGGRKIKAVLRRQLRLLHIEIQG